MYFDVFRGPCLFNNHATCPCNRHSIGEVSFSGKTMKNTDSAKSHPFPSPLFFIVKILWLQCDEFHGCCFNSSHETQATVLIDVLEGSGVKRALEEMLLHCRGQCRDCKRMGRKFVMLVGG